MVLFVVNVKTMNTNRNYLVNDSYTIKSFGKDEPVTKRLINVLPCNSYSHRKGKADPIHNQLVS